MRLILVILLTAALQGDARQWYETGCQQLEEGSFHKAAVSLEKALVQAGKDEALKGQIFRKLAYTFNASGDQERAAQNLYDAYGAFPKPDGSRMPGTSCWNTARPSITSRTTKRRNRCSNRPCPWPMRPETP